MDSACDELLASAGLPRNQNSGIRWSDFGSLGKNSLQRRRSTHNFLEHRGPVDFFPERDVFMLQSLLGPLAIFDIGPGDVPAGNLSLFVRKQNAKLNFVIRALSNRPFDCSLPLASIFGMYSLQPLFPRGHPFSRIKSVYAIPLIRKMQCVSVCDLPSPTAHVGQPLRFCEVRFVVFYLPIEIPQSSSCFIEDSSQVSEFIIPR